MNKIKLWLVRRWLYLLPIKELRDEMWKRTMNDWYKDVTELMLNTFRQEYLCDWKGKDDDTDRSN